MAEVEPGQIAQSIGISEDWANRLELALARSFLGFTIWNTFWATLSGTIPGMDELQDMVTLVCTIAGV